jgi:2-keto-4-pentenoate hydratase/2-oxohepta-3-ene-1,7-dioic acid hydratase in catechol pathway
MKLLSFSRNNKATWGVATDAGVIDCGSLFPTLRAALEANGLDKVKAFAAGRAADAKLADITFLPVIPDPGKIICVGLNYQDHVKETKRDNTENPALFIRLAESQVGHNQPILLPPESTHLDFECEIAVIIGKAGRRISEKDSWSHIAGYAPYNDGSIRDWQRHTIQWTAGKNFSKTGGFGPWMMTRDEIKDDEELSIETRLNGQVMQHSTTRHMIFSIPVLIKYISTFTTLQPGDVIVTGTPGGVGARREPPVWMKAGDKVEIELGKVGVLVNTIAKE